MTVDARMERLYRQIELVRGRGDPKRGQLCVMSFVAFLAGEGHTDHPSTASSVIRQFAISVNDDMPAQLRQRLKPFAPRILGTNDPFEQRRIEILQSAVRDELLPRIAVDFAETRKSRPVGARNLATLLMNSGPPREQMMYLAEKALSVPPGLGADVPASAARLISLCAQSAPLPAEQEWYWNKAIELLDRLCDVGAEQARPEARTDRLEWLEGTMARRRRRKERRMAALAILSRLRDKLPAF